jgi:hypothetical protein
MDYFVRLCDVSNEHCATIKLDNEYVDRSASDIVFDIIGAPAESLVKSNRLAADDAFDLKQLQALIFDQDSQGMFIRNGVNFLSGGRELDPERPLTSKFEAGITPAGKAYTIQIEVAAAPAKDVEELEEFGRMMLLHQISVGNGLDVTQDYPEINHLLKWAEQHGLIEIDVKRAAYKLTAAGKKQHDQWMSEAQDLVRRFDILADVDVDAGGKARFDTSLGDDYRVAAYEISNINPYRARLLLGLNDGEWNDIGQWEMIAADRNWYQKQFEPIDKAISADELGRERLESVMRQAKDQLRHDGIFQ